MAPRFFDPWLTVPNEIAAPIIASLNTALDFTGDLAKPGGGGTPRRRKRRPQDAANLKAMLHAIVANLAWEVVHGGGALLVRLSKRQSTYARAGFQLFPKLLMQLDRAGLLTLRKSRKAGIASNVEPTAEFRRAVLASGIGPGDFALARDHKAGNVFITKSTIMHEQGGRRVTQCKRPPDAPPVHTAERECQQVNDIICGVHLTRTSFDGPEELDATVHALVGPGAPDFRGRTLRRYFHDPDLTTGGRLYGGWWQNLPRSQRHTIRIEGERVAIVDFASMFPRLAYVTAGKAPPHGDLYAGIAGERDGIKRVFNAMLFRDTPLTKFPKGSRKHFPKGTTAAQVRAAIIRKHPTLGPILESGIGLRLMKLESDILVAVILAMASADVPALPLHDAVIVRQSDSQRAARIMQGEAARITGYHLPVEIKPC